MKYIILLLGTLLIFANCQAALDSTKDPQMVGIDSFSIAGRTDSSINAIVYAQIHNPNGTGVTIRSIDGELFLDDLFMGTIRLEESTRLGRKDTVQVPIPIEIPLAGALAQIGALSQSEDVEMRLEGAFKVTALLIPLKLKKKMTERLNLKQLIDEQVQKYIQETALRIKKIRPGAQGFGGGEWKAYLEGSNKLNLEYYLHDIDLEFSFEGNEAAFGRWQRTEDLLVPAKDNYELVAEIEVDNSEIMRQGIGAVFGKKPKVHVVGEAKVRVGDFSFPFPVDQLMDLGSIGL